MNTHARKLLAAIFAAMLAIGVFALAGCSQSSSSSAASSTASSSAASSSADSSAAATQTITDMVGRTVEVPANPQKIIGVGSSSLRMISYLQATDKVAGVELGEQDLRAWGLRRPGSDFVGARGISGE